MTTYYIVRLVMATRPNGVWEPYQGKWCLMLAVRYYDLNVAYRSAYSLRNYCDGVCAQVEEEEL